MPLFCVRREGFTLLELLVTLVVIGLIIGMILPRITMRRASSEWPQVVAHFNDLAILVQQTALRTGKISRLAVEPQSGGGGRVLVEEQKKVNAEEADQKSGMIKYAEVDDPIISGVYDIPSDIRIVKVYTPNDLEKTSESRHNCFVIPGGMAQEMVLHLERSEDYGVSRHSLVMNPFFGLFDSQEGFASFSKHKVKQ